MAETKQWFGDTDFGLQVEARCRDGRRQFGGVLLWINGAPVGDWLDDADLNSAARTARRFLAASEGRTDSELAALPARDAIDAVVSPDPWAGFNVRPFWFDEVGESSWRDKAHVVIVRRRTGEDASSGCCTPKSAFRDQLSRGHL